MGGHVISVLYVDDDLQLLEIVKDYLERSGEFSVHTATSVKSAIEMMGSNNYDAILSDYQLAGPTGIDLLRYIRTTDDRIPFLLFTGRGREEVVIEALNCGADFYLEKGIDLVTQFMQMEHEIREAVRRRHAEAAQKKMEKMLHITNAAVRSAQNPILITDLAGNLIFVNPAYLSTFSYTENGEVLGTPVTDFFASPVVANAVVDELVRNKAWSGEVVARKKGGDLFDVRVVANEISNESGEVMGYVASCTDLTEQKQAYSQLDGYIRYLKRVSVMAADLAECPSSDNIFNRIAECLAALVPEGTIVLVSSIREEDSIFRVEAARGVEHSLPAIEAFFERSLVGLCLPATREYLDALRKGNFARLGGGVRELTFGQLPPDRCRALERLLPGGEIWGAGFTWKGQVKGVTALLLPPETTIWHLDILDLMIRNAAAVLQRREAEEALAGK
jgi:PAS domain S-box-containing protein